MNEIQDELAKEFLLKAETSMKQDEYTEVVFGVAEYRYEFKISPLL